MEITKAMIDIASGKVWDDYLRAHLEAKVWHSTPFPLYNDIIVLVDGYHVTGKDALEGNHKSESADEVSTPILTLHVFQNVNMLLQYHQLQLESIQVVPMQS
ncbi:hypothetical protein EDB19DRAFT_1824052 [Suillus lakei]|nr:hypothetical protein EDB19DRAFT_1824052 [Suillus lakei]